MALTDKTVGIIGVGMMGHGIAGNILKGGWSVKFLDHPGNQPVDDLRTAGATSEATCADVAAASDIVILCVTGTPEVEAVLQESGGVLEGLRSNSLVIDCSTSIPGSTKENAKLVQGAGGNFLDAAMTRTPKEAEEGKLNLIIGGNRMIFEDTRPLFESFADNIVFGGPVGSGHTLKLLHNFVALGFSVVMAEALAAAAKSGVDMATYLDVLEQGAGRGVILDRFRPFMENGDTEAFRFTVANAHKDLGYYVQMAEDLAAGHISADAVRAVYESAVGENPSAPVPELVRLLQKD
jgi:3-hydroxyisobutyrate dehydrogenase-like beta-hydroxyacid dehydrogenase